MKTIRVLVVDDSPLVRKFIVSTLSSEKDIEVVDTASDGIMALRKIQHHKPDVVTLDLNMPRMDGLATMKEVMRVNPVPIVVFSSANRASADIALKSLSLGAVDFLSKPNSNNPAVIQKMKMDLKNKVRAASSVNLKTVRGSDNILEGENQQAEQEAPKQETRTSTAVELIFSIGCSTGGPKALEAILSKLPSNFSAFIGIVQHMTDPFINVFAENLNKVVPMEVRIAKDGDIFQPGLSLIAPGSANMIVAKIGGHYVARVQPIGDDAPSAYPSVDKFFYSVAKTFRKNAVGILLTGMGKDGAMGMKAIKTVGGVTLAQDAATSVVYGMPKAAIELKAVDKVVALPYIHAMMKRMVSIV